MKQVTQSLQGEPQPPYCVKDALPLCACPQPPFAQVPDSEVQRCRCTMPCEAKAEVARKTRARADFIVK